MPILLYQNAILVLLHSSVEKIHMTAAITTKANFLPRKLKGNDVQQLRPCNVFLVPWCQTDLQ
jgi:hypothetical protein